MELDIHDGRTQRIEYIMRAKSVRRSEHAFARLLVCLDQTPELAARCVGIWTLQEILAEALERIQRRDCLDRPFAVHVVEATVDFRANSGRCLGDDVLGAHSVPSG
jgi:hypothetical protein